MAKLYMNFDTGVVWTEDEVRQMYEQFRSEDFDSFEDYLDQMLDLGKQCEGGLVLVEREWYAVLYDPSDAWDYGSYDFDEAVSMANADEADIIAVIDDHTDDPICIKELHRGEDFDYTANYAVVRDAGVVTEVTDFETEQDAVEYAKREYDHLSSHDKKHTSAMYIVKCTDPNPASVTHTEGDVIYTLIGTLYTADRETGTFIDSFDNLDDALNAIADYEDEDEEAGTYTENFYDVVDQWHKSMLR